MITRRLGGRLADSTGLIDYRLVNETVKPRETLIYERVCCELARIKLSRYDWRMGYIGCV